MNKVELVGRLTKDADVRYGGANNSAVAHFTMAVDRRFKREGDSQTADFISCVAFGKTAEFLEKYGHKGVKFGLTGRIQTGSYTNKDNQTVYTTDVVAEELEFVESKKSNETPAPAPNDIGDGFMNIPDGIDEQLPFN